MSKAKVEGAAVAETQDAIVAVEKQAGVDPASIQQENAAEIENALQADVAGAPANGSDVALAEAQREVIDITNSLIPLARYLRDEEFLPGPDEPTTAAMIADAALQALQESKAGLVELHSQIEALTPDPSQIKHKKTKPISVGSKVDHEEFERATTVVFGDSNGNLITDLPPLSFSSDKFSGAANGRTLNAEIEFPVHAPARRVAAAFLVDAKGKAVSVCEFVSPLSVSGGGSARINSGSLLFRAPKKSVAEAGAA
jgi:hypothetical protein